MAPHSSTLAWKIPWMEEPGRLQSMGSVRVGHDWATSLSRIGEGSGNPLQCSCLENPRDGGAWWAAICGVSQSQHDWSDLAAAAWRIVSSAYWLYIFLPPFKIGLSVCCWIVRVVHVFWILHPCQKQFEVLVLCSNSVPQHYYQYAIVKS